MRSTSRGHLDGTARSRSAQRGHPPSVMPGVPYRPPEGGFDPGQPSVIPFNLSLLSHKGIHTQSDTPELYDLAPEQMANLAQEVGEYVDNLEMSVRDVFADSNRKLYRRLQDTSSIPLSFLYMRLMQHSLKLTGECDPNREKVILHNLSTLLDA
eukprot:PhF_6_TR17385/c0_g1_i1/m.26616